MPEPLPQNVNKLRRHGHKARYQPTPDLELCEYPGFGNYPIQSPMPDSPRVLSVNVSPIQEFERDARSWRTAIMKKPVSGPVRAHKLGLEGDDQADKSVHGGPYRALYAYPHQHYAYWEQHAGLTDWPLGGFSRSLRPSVLLM